GVRNRGEGENDADRLRHLDQAALRELANYADRAFVPDVVVDELRGHHVLKSLVFQNPKPGFFDGQAGQILNLFQAGQDHLFHNAIDVLLRALGKNGGGGSGLPYESFQVSDPFITEGCRHLWHTLCPVWQWGGAGSLGSALRIPYQQTPGSARRESSPTHNSFR